MAIVGLGNPGARYRGTRHNAGAAAVSHLAAAAGERLAPAHRSLVASARLGDRRVILAIPQTYMNDSGQAVAAVVRYYRLDPTDQLVVVHDELDLPLGRVRLKFGGGLAGHNGLRSVAKALGTQDFWRVRIGIGRPEGRIDVVDWVLQEARGEDGSVLEAAILRAAEVIEDLLVLGPARAMTLHNAHGLDRPA